MAADLDIAALRAWLGSRVDGVGDDLAAERIAGGQSNPTWVLTSGTRSWVLRAKPAPTERLPRSAHAIEREYAVQAALAGTGVPVPTMRALCEDESVVGVMFYVMDHVPGRVFREAWAPGIEPVERAAVFDSMVAVLAALHAVDIDALGLRGYGAPGDYFARLFSRWTRMYDASRTHDVPTIASMERLAEWLPAHVPAHGTDEVTLVHGDFRLENLIIDGTAPRVRAVLDWELSTLGHPLVDAGYTALPWHLTAGPVRGFVERDLEALGIPSEEDFVRRYCELAGRSDVEQVLADWPFYVACNAFRLGAILQGIAKRVEDGIAAGPNAAETGAAAGPVADTGWEIVNRQL